MKSEILKMKIIEIAIIIHSGCLKGEENANVHTVKRKTNINTQTHKLHTGNYLIPSRNKPKQSFFFFEHMQLLYQFIS